jgi:uncharacterized protein (UPF0548 family)
MRAVRRGNSAAVSRALLRAATAQPSWIGDPELEQQPGYHSEVYRSRLGTGQAVYDAAVETVLTWGVQRGAGLIVQPTAPRVQVGVDVIVGLPVGPALILAPCRVTDVFTSTDRGGFRYVTLPGHPEVGFEEFIVERTADGDVWFVVRPVSRAGSILTAMAGPIARAIQRRAGRRYLRAMAVA